MEKRLRDNLHCKWYMPWSGVIAQVIRLNTNPTYQILFHKQLTNMALWNYCKNKVHIVEQVALSKWQRKYPHLVHYSKMFVRVCQRSLLWWFPW